MPAMVRPRTHEKVWATAARLASEACRELALLGPGGVVSLPRVVDFRKRFGLGTANAEEALRIARDYLSAVGADARQPNKRAILYMAGNNMQSPQGASESLAATALQHEEKAQRLIQSCLQKNSAEGVNEHAQRQRKNKSHTVLSITAAADSLTAGVRNALEDGAEAVIFSPAAKGGGITAEAVKQRFGCGSEKAQRVLWHARARLSMAGFKSEGFRQNSRQVVYLPASATGSTSPKRPVGVPGLTPVKRLKTESDFEQQLERQPFRLIAEVAGTDSDLRPEAAGGCSASAETSLPSSQFSHRLSQLPAAAASASASRVCDLLPPLHSVQGSGSQPYRATAKEEIGLRGTHMGPLDWATSTSCERPARAVADGASSKMLAEPPLPPPSSAPGETTASLASPQGQLVDARGGLLGHELLPAWTMRLLQMLGGGALAGLPMASTCQYTCQRILDDALACAEIP